MTGPFRIEPTGGIFQVGARMTSPCLPFPTEIRLNPAAAEYVHAVTDDRPLPPAGTVYVHVDGTVMRLAGSGKEGRPRGPFGDLDAIVDPAVRVPAIRTFLGEWARERTVAHPAVEVASIERALETVPPYAHLWIYQQRSCNPLWVKVLLVRAGMVDTCLPLAADPDVVAALRNIIAPDTALDHAIDQLRTARQRYFPTAAPTELPQQLRAGWEERLRTVPRVAFAMLTSARLSEAMTLFLAHHFGVHTGFPASANEPVTTP